MPRKYNSKTAAIAVEIIPPIRAALERRKGSPCEEFNDIIEQAKRKLPPGRCVSAVMLTKRKFLIQLSGIFGSCDFILHLREDVARDLFDPQVVA